MTFIACLDYLGIDRQTERERERNGKTEREGIDREKKLEREGRFNEIV